MHFKQIRSLCLFISAFVILSGVPAHAAIAPFQFQHDATDVMVIRIQSVFEDEDRVKIEAVIIRVHKSSKDFQPGDAITLDYQPMWITRRHSFWQRLNPMPGPQELFPPDIPPVGSKLLAYLKPSKNQETNTWMPAAHQYSFDSPESEPVLDQ